MCYAIDDPKSFDRISKWMENVKELAPKNVVTVLVGNKIDLEGKRVITYEDG